MTRLPADDADIGVGLGGAKINESGNNDCDLLGRRLGNHALPVVARGGAEAGQSCRSSSGSVAQGYSAIAPAPPAAPSPRASSRAPTSRRTTTAAAGRLG